MGEFPNKATQFSSTNQPKGVGRKKKIYTILKETGYGADDVRIAFGELINYDMTELKKIKDDETKPIIVRITAKQLISAFNNESWNKIREILEHAIGKPPQVIEQTVSHLSREEREARIAELANKLK